jgi:methylmalonyl-CoA mutase
MAGEADRAELDDWRRQVALLAKGGDALLPGTRTRDGILVEPLYRPRLDTEPLPGRGAGRWLVTQVVDHPDAQEANAQALADLRGGATGLAFRFAQDGRRAGITPTETNLQITLDNLDPAVFHLRLEPHPNGADHAEWLRELIAAGGLAPERAAISFGLDPIGPAALVGVDGVDPQSFVAGLLRLRTAGFGRGLATLDSRPFHEAGASEVQELAALLASAAWWLGALDDKGMPPRMALSSFDAALSVDRDQLLSIAKLRALRLLWARLAELCGAAPARLPIHAETSRRMLTRADPHTNILRSTIAAFAAAVGGADSIAVVPFTDPLGVADRNARAIARNTQHLLLEESHLFRVADPAAGSGGIEALTEALAESAWREFQAIEAEGGILTSLQTSAFPARIAEARNALVAEVTSGARPLVGATVFQDGRKPDEVGRDALIAPMATGLIQGMRLEDLARVRS